MKKPQKIGTLINEFMTEIKPVETIYYYSIQRNVVWFLNDQYEMRNMDWETACACCKAICQQMKTQVRLCKTKGYNNQGYYFHPQDKF